MGTLTDTSLLARHADFRNLVDAAIMTLVRNVMNDPSMLGDVNDPEQREMIAQRVAMINEVVREVQGDTPRSYTSRMFWLVAMNEQVRTSGIVKNGAVDVSKFNDDNMFLDAVGEAFFDAVDMTLGAYLEFPPEVVEEVEEPVVDQSPIIPIPE